MEGTLNRTEYYDRLRAVLTVLHGEDKAAKARTVCENTALPAKGKYRALPGVTDYRTLSDKRLEILVHKIEKLAKAHPHQPAAQVPQVAEAPPVDREDYYQRLRAALAVLHGDDNAAKAHTIWESSAIPSDGEHRALPGVHDYRTLPDMRLELLVHRVEELAMERLESHLAEFAEALEKLKRAGKWRSYQDFAAQDEGEQMERELLDKVKAMRGRLQQVAPERLAQIDQ